MSDDGDGFLLRSRSFMVDDILLIWSSRYQTPDNARFKGCKRNELSAKKNTNKRSSKMVLNTFVNSTEIFQFSLMYVVFNDLNQR